MARGFSNKLEGTIKMNTEYELEDYANDGLFYIINIGYSNHVEDKGTPPKWYVLRFWDYSRNGGQETKEYEHDFGFATKAGAIKWAHNNARKIAEEKEIGIPQ